MNYRRFLAVLPLVVLLGSRAHAAPRPDPPLITVDEFGNGIGTTGSASLETDLGPGGLPGVLTYHLPFPGVPGDVLLHDADEPDNPLGDLIRFNGDGTLLFYSDNTDGADAPGDTPTPPRDVYDNIQSIAEVGPEGDNGAIYTPGPNDPGFDPSGPTYHFVSDGIVPEPGSLALLATGGLPLLGFLRRRKLA